MSNIQPHFRCMGRQKGRIYRSGFAAAWKRQFAMMILLLVVCSGTERSKAQTTAVSNHSATNFFDTVVDAYGKRYALGQLSTDDKIRSAYNAITYSPMVASSCETGYFKCYFDNGSGFEDDANPVHLQRRAVLCQVLHDLSQMIKSPCSTTGQKVNLWIQDAGTGSGILGAGTPFFNFPFLTSTSGIVDNTAWITINSGKDAFIDAAAPISTSGGGSTAGTYFHGAIKFNFDGSVNWNYNLAGTPGADTADFYTVCLHEISHILGFMSLIDFTGDSYIGSGFKYYTRYDQFLKTPGGDSLLTNSTPACNMYNWRFNPSLTPSAVLAPGTSGICAGTVPDHTNCANAIKYTGSVTQSVYTPTCFKFGSSLSHFEDECWVPAGFPLGSAGPATNNQYFVLSNGAPSGAYNATTNPGVMKRYLTPEERKVFCDIGYTMDTVFGNAYNHNYKTYSGGICNGIQVAGINDGIVDGAYSFIVSGGTTSVNINPASNPFLRNDHGADRFKCLEIISGTGTLSVTSGDSTTTVNYGYVFGTTGVQLLRYIPYNSVTGQEGNVTYIYVYAASSSCVPDACNLVPNRGFESLVPSSYTPTLVEGATCWSSFNGSPDLFNRYDLSTAANIPNSYNFGAPGQAEVHSFSATPNDHYAGFLGAPTAIPDVYNMESMSALLTSPMHTGMTYQVSFWAKMATYNHDTIPAKIQFATSPTIVAPAGGFLSALPAGMTELCNFTITYPDDNWHYYTQNITYTGTAPAIMLAVLDAPYLMPVGYYAYHHGNYIGIDDISITPLTVSSTFILPDTLCSATGVINLDTTVGIPGGTFTWYADTAGVVYTSHSNIFDASSAYAASLDAGGSGLVTVCYNYTDALGCGGQICHSVQLITHSFSITASPSTICAGDSSTLTSGGPASAVYTWSPSVSCIGAGCNAAKVSPAATTTYTANAVSMCPATVTVTVIPTSPITGGNYICLGGTLALHDSVSGGMWSSSAATVATVSASGIASGITAGTAIITYTMPSGCNVTKLITVTPPPAAVTGTTAACLGSTATLSDATAGGTWSSLTPSVATIGAATGIVTSIATGTSVIRYTLATGCISSITFAVNPLPAAITGGSAACLGGTATLSDATAGGTWSSSSTAIATVSGSGVVTGAGSGTVTITYSLPTGCYTTTAITVGSAPAISGGNTFCMYNSSDLTGTPSGGTWSISDPSIAAIYSSGHIVGLASGTATVTYSMGSGCSVTEEVYIFGPVGTNDCSPCAMFAGKAVNTIGYTGTVSGSIGAGNYYIPADVTIDGDVDLTDAIVYVAPGAKINVNPNSSLTISGAHLFTCSVYMWTGIQLNSDGGQTGRITLQGDAAGISTLIEDAKYGVYADAPVTPAGGGGGTQYINSTNAIFNRDYVGMYIGHYNPMTVGGGTDPHVYEFHIENSVFTSRDFGKYNRGGVYYPYVWPNAGGTTGALKNEAAYTSPYVLPYYITQYPAAKCHNLLPAYVGIQLDSVGVLADDYAGVVIGAPSTQTLAFGSVNNQLNIFEQLGFGIYATNSNVTTQNSVYANMHYIIDKAAQLTPEFGNAGIYTTMDDGQKYQMQIVPGYYTDPATGHLTISGNSFYDCSYEVYSNDYYHIGAYRNKLMTSRTGSYGFYLQSSSYDSVTVKNNRMYNVDNGVLMMTNMGASYWVPTLGGGPGGYFALGSQHAGQINIDSNHIQATIGTALPDTERLSFGIVVMNAVNDTASSSVGLPGLMYAEGTVHTDHNTITNANRGILVQSYWKQKAYTLNNYVTVWKDTRQGSISYGINHTDCAKDLVQANAVKGVTAGGAMDDSVRGYYACYNSGMEMGCNTATSTGRGFEFFKQNPATDWHDNTMSSNRFGMYLNDGLLGDQGSYDYPSDNIWDTGTPWDGVSYTQTYVDGTESCFFSRIFAKTNAANYPTVNHSLYPTNFYSDGLGSLEPSLSTYIYDCIISGGVGGGTGAGARHGGLHQQFVQKRVNYSVDSAGNDFLGQYVTYQSVLNDSTLTDSSTVLQSFKALAENSRFAYLKNIEQSLANGNTADVSAKLDAEPLAITDSGTYADSTTGVVVADDHASDYIIDNYKQFYRLYTNYLQKSLSSDDSVQVMVMAGMCPSRYGTAVYRSRCLYTLVFCDLRTWNDDSCSAADTGAHIAARNNNPAITQTNATDQAQQYQLFPNPNNGNITISQLVVDNKAVKIEVLDVTGRSMYKNNAQFSGGSYHLQLDKLIPGVYLLQLTDGNQKRFNFKFVKE